MFHRLIATVLASLFLVAPAPAQADTTCQDVTYPVSLAGTPQTMAATLCVPTGARTIQVLVPGGLYNRSYWDITVDPAIHSFRRAMNNAGYATPAVDRLDAGQSSVPPSALVTAIAQAGPCTR